MKISTILVFLLGVISCQDQIKLEPISYGANPVDYIYRRHYTESLSNATKLSDIGTPSGAKISISKNNFQISADFRLDCNYSIDTDSSMDVSSCLYTEAS